MNETREFDVTPSAPQYFEFHFPGIVRVTIEYGYRDGTVSDYINLRVFALAKKIIFRTSQNNFVQYEYFVC